MASRRGIVADHEATEAAVGDPVHVDRVLPDYTWPWRVPLEQLRRLVDRESAAAVQMANQCHVRTP